MLQLLWRKTAVVDLRVENARLWLQNENVIRSKRTLEKREKITEIRLKFEHNLFGEQAAQKLKLFSFIVELQIYESKSVINTLWRRTAFQIILYYLQEDQPEEVARSSRVDQIS